MLDASLGQGILMQPRTLKWLTGPSVALAQELAVMGPLPLFGQVTPGLPRGWL